MMTRMEASILAALGDEPKPPCVLYATATGDLPVDVDEVVRVHISNIRKKLAEYGLETAIVTVVGKGYMWAPDGVPPRMRWEQCAWCGVSFDQPRINRRPFRYCSEHRHYTYRQRISWRRKRAA